MIAHHMSAAKKIRLFHLFGLEGCIDHYLALSSYQRNFLTQNLLIDAEQVFFTPFMVDSRFYHPGAVPDENPIKAAFGERALICATGREFRDYPTLIDAIEGVNADLVITTSSAFSKRADSSQRNELPPNVHLNRYSYRDLRALYGTSRFVVVPLLEVNFQAGCTSILEAMCMGKAVICTRVPGQTDLVIEGETGLYVNPGDVEDLRSAIQYLLDNPEEAARMGANGRARVMREMTLDRYSEKLGQVVHAAV
jgi:glycosyltransferase involved in cell wall biosynthesis